MHETAIVMGLIRIIETHAARVGVHRVIRVKLKIGRLRAVEPQQLRSCFEMFAEGTVAEGAQLVIDVLGVRGRCRACASEFEVARYVFECPACAGNDIEVIQGQELYIENFEADSAAAGDRPGHETQTPPDLPTPPSLPFSGEGKTL